MQELFSSGHIADLVLAVMIVEAAVILTLGRSRLRHGARGYVGNLLAGAALVVALRLALTGGGWISIAIALLVSMTGHLVDVAERISAQRNGPSHAKY